MRCESELLCRLLGLFGAVGMVRIAAALATVGSLAPRGTRRVFSSGAGLGNDRARSQHLDKLAHRRRKLATALVDDCQRTEESSLLELEHLERAAGHLV